MFNPPVRIWMPILSLRVLFSWASTLASLALDWRHGMWELKQGLQGFYRPIPMVVVVVEKVCLEISPSPAQGSLPAPAHGTTAIQLPTTHLLVQIQEVVDDTAKGSVWPEAHVKQLLGMVRVLEQLVRCSLQEETTCSRTYSRASANISCLCTSLALHAALAGLCKHMQTHSSPTLLVLISTREKFSPMVLRFFFSQNSSMPRLS